MKYCLQCKTSFNSENWLCPACGFCPQIDGGYPIFAPELSQENDTYSADSFAYLAQLEKGHFWFEARNTLLLWAVEQYFPDTRKLLEIGCGTGFVLKNFHQHLPGVVLFGSDLLIEGLDFAKQRVPTADLYQMDARAIPFKQEFDLIGAFDVIEHIDEDEMVLSQLHNAVKPGGGIIISVPQHQFLWSAVDDRSYHKRRYSRADLTGKVKRAGFEIIKTTSFVSLLLPMMLLSRLRKSKQTQNSELKPRVELKLNPILNMLFSRVMSVEVALIRLGIPFRLGGSRLLIAKRPE